MRTPAKSINDLFGHADSHNRMLRMIRCTDMDAASARILFSSEMNIDAATIILTLGGAADFEINRRRTTAAASSATLLSSSHLVRITSCTDDFACICLAVGEEFMREMDSVDMIYKRIRYGAKLFDRPVTQLTPEQSRLAAERLRELQRAIGNSGHLYYREVVLNRLFAFYLDLSDTIDRAQSAPTTEHAARYESIVKRFIELLTANYRTEHKVAFYASQLHLSVHYLTLIVKEVTGRSVSDFIYGMLYSDARALLSESRMSVQEITSLLNFSDQSAFGKFFKRRAGLSPLDFRKKQH